MKGSENEVHIHRYKVEATLMGSRLDKCGFLVDVNIVTITLEKVLKRFEGEILNEMPEFRGITPSMENIAKVIWSKLAADIDRSCIEHMKVAIWEADDICASFEQ
jgi:6-pyruvoyltetrahydropterin/6-carboxytetrahydropterin synthase